MHYIFEIDIYAPFEDPILVYSNSTLEYDTVFMQDNIIFVMGSIILITFFLHLNGAHGSYQI